MTEVDFKKQLQLGKQGEEKVFNYLNNLEESVSVIDASDYPLFQGLGIDGILITDTNFLSFMCFDIKTDYNYHRSGKLFIEIMADVNMNKEGGILSSRAEIFFYYDPYGGKLFELPLFGMRRWYDAKGISMKHKEITNQYNQQTTGVVVSPEDLVAAGVTLKVFDIGPLIYA